ncbi:MAG: Tyrosine recombinase XerD [Syntrophus sp. PtaU1.Bin005]|jgi:integrase|nr:MAG: Tyrosine recombinase XerD [Syntrophus sp. PtaU1.Bin005]
MAIKWIQSEQKGVRYYVHPTKKYREGESGPYKKDRCYVIRYQAHGKRYEHVVGWASELDPKDGKHWNELKAATLRAELMGNAKGHQEVKTISDMREKARKQEEAKQAEVEKKEKESITFGKYFKDTYFPDMAHKKSKDVEQFIYDKWICPLIGKLRINDLTDFHLKKIKKNMEDSGKAVRTIHYAFAIVSQVWNRARKDKIVQRDCPTRDVKLPRIDNQKKRFLSPQEANDLLAYLKNKSQQLYELAYLSLYTGARFGELAGLTWRRINLKDGSIIFRNTKSGKDRTVFMTEGVKALFEAMPEGKADGLIFPDRKGKRIFSVSATFDRAIADLGLNKGVVDPRDKITFHSLRHTHASWLVNNGTNLFLVKEILGHADFKMTTRYSHPAADSIRQAMVGLEKKIPGMAESQTGQVVNFSKET